MLNRDFNTWLSGFRGSIADYGYYIDFEKVYRNIDKIKIELNIMNSLIGSKNIKADFKDLMKKYPEVMKCIPLLLAVYIGNKIHSRINQRMFNYSTYGLLLLSGAMILL